MGKSWAAEPRQDVDSELDRHAGDARIRCIRDPHELFTLETSWNTLLRESASDCLFLSWEWISHWWRVFGTRFALRTLVVYGSENEIHGIAPLMIDQQGRVMLIGQKGDTKAEYLDFIVRRGSESWATPLFFDYLANQLSNEWTQIFFERVPTLSVNLRLMHQACLDASLRVELKKEERAPYLELPATWDSFLRSKKKNFRYQWKKNWKQLKERGTVSFLVAGIDIPFEKAFDHLLRLNSKRWGERRSSFRTDDSIRFHSAFARELLHSRRLVLILMRVDNRVVAANYDFLYGGKVWGMQGGWDREYGRQRVGTLILGQAIRWAIENGQREYDFLGGDSLYKRRWTSDMRSMINLCAVSPARTESRE